MSTFKRKSNSITASVQTGTRASPFSSSTVLTSTGIASLDDILGGGLPLSSSLLVIAPDTHSSYGELVQKYFISQGLASGQKVCVVDGEPGRFVSECMWHSNGTSAPSVTTGGDDKDDGNETDHEAKVEIAWRYEHLKPFSTSASGSQFSADDFCCAFDLTYRVPAHFLDQAIKSSQLMLLDASRDWTRLIDGISEGLATSQDVRPIRVCVPLLGSPAWGDPHPKDILQFAYSLSTLLRRYPHTCASVGLPPYMSDDKWGGPGWLNKLGWLFDASVTLAGFSDPSVSLTFPSYHGSVHIHALPTRHSLLPASDKSSTLRGISSVSGSRENNIAFKCTRKRLVFETHHLDIEGGVGERRTTGTEKREGEKAVRRGLKGKDLSAGVAWMEVGIEGETRVEAAASAEKKLTGGLAKKKRVTFRGEERDLYDF